MISEDILDAIGGISDESVAFAAKPARRRKALRIAALAAAVCAIGAAIALTAALSSREPADINHGVTYSYLKYAAFEELLPYSDLIIKADCIKAKESNENMIYTFRVKDVYYGEIDTKKDITVYSPKSHYSVTDGEQAKTVYSFDSSDISYEKGRSYFLALTKHSSPFYDEDRYYSVSAALYLPVSDVSECSLYGEPLYKHSKVSASATEDDLVGYINGLLSQDGYMIEKKQSGVKYIKDTDFDNVISESDFILIIKTEKQITDGIPKDRAVFECSVNEVIKGEIGADEKIEIVFLADSVKCGDTVIAALSEVDGCSPRSFVISSKKSVFSLGDKERIEKIIDK